MTNHSTLPMRTRLHHTLLATATASALLMACGSGDAPASDGLPSLPAPGCDDSLKGVFGNDAATTVTLVKAYRPGDPLVLADTPASPAPAITTKALCLVKLVVGPGHAGPANAPSASPGIGIEVWLPAVSEWNGRLHVLGSGGWGGGSQIASTTQIGAPFAVGVAVSEGAVSAQSDTGHRVDDGSFAMNPDGTVDAALWTDFASRAAHELALKTRALATAYYGSAPARAYWDSCSTGGRQGHMEALLYPSDFDGILAAAPALYWTRFLAADLYPQVVMQRDLGAAGLGTAQRSLASAAAVSACDAGLTGRHEGFVSDPAACRYDPTQDASVLCVASGGGNTSAACLGTAQAAALNKIWYGQTADGSAPPPRVDNGMAATLAATQRWFGLTRGTELGLVAGPASDAPFFGPFTIATDQAALSLQSPRIAAPSFVNATGPGADGWKALSYVDLASAAAQGLALQPVFGNVNTESTDLGAFRDRGGKLLVVHGLADQLIPPQGSMHYFARVANAMGGSAATQAFYRLFLVPGMGHCTGVGSVNGLPAVSPPADPPLPAAGQMYQALTDWVEHGAAPQNIVVQSTGGTLRRPLCMYPSRLTYLGGATNDATSFGCL